jgi:hypothetical protein
MEKKNLGKIAIFAGRGNLPKMLIEECKKNNQDFQLFLLSSEKYENDYSEFNPYILSYGQVGEFLKILSKENIKDLIFLGAVNKPEFSSLKVDKEGSVLISKILLNKILGDDSVLKAVVKFFEKRKINILKADDLLDCVISKKGTITKCHPNHDDFENIDLGSKAIKYFSQFDVGQSIIISQKQIIAVEAIEGTDEMIKRVGKLSLDLVKNSILIKLKKKNQTHKIDLPTIGIETIENCAKAQIKGIAVESNSTIILQKDEVIKRANELNIFIEVI